MMTSMNPNPEQSGNIQFNQTEIISNAQNASHVNSDSNVGENNQYVSQDINAKIQIINQFPNIKSNINTNITNDQKQSAIDSIPDYKKNELFKKYDSFEGTSQANNLASDKSVPYNYQNPLAKDDGNNFKCLGSADSRFHLDTANFEPAEYKSEYNQLSLNNNKNNNNSSNNISNTYKFNAAPENVNNPMNRVKENEGNEINVSGPPQNNSPYFNPLLNKNYNNPLLRNNNEINKKRPRTPILRNYDNYGDNNNYKLYSQNTENKYFNENKNVLLDGKEEQRFVQYKEEINRLKQNISNLENRNNLLNTQLQQELQKNIKLQQNISNLNNDLSTIQQNNNDNYNELNNIIYIITNSLQVNSPGEIIPKLNKMITFINNSANNSQKSNNNNNNEYKRENKIRDELISKLQSLYIDLTSSNEQPSEIDIKTIWRWIKHLVNTVKSLALEKENNIELYQGLQQSDECKNFCLGLMHDFNIQNLEELKAFINDLLDKNSNNDKKMRKLKQVLIPNEEEDNLNQYQTNFNSNNYINEEQDYNNQGGNNMEQEYNDNNENEENNEENIEEDDNYESRQFEQYQMNPNNNTNNLNQFSNNYYNEDDN